MSSFNWYYQPPAMKLGNDNDDLNSSVSTLTNFKDEMNNSSGSSFCSSCPYCSMSQISSQQDLTFQRKTSYDKILTAVPRSFTFQNGQNSSCHCQFTTSNGQCGCSVNQNRSSYQQVSASLPEKHVSVPEFSTYNNSKVSIQIYFHSFSNLILNCFLFYFKQPGQDGDGATATEFVSRIQSQAAPAPFLWLPVMHRIAAAEHSLWKYFFNFMKN